MADKAPLLTRHASDPVALLSRALPEVGLDKGLVSAACFLAQLQCIAQRLPAHQYVVNLCDNRYLFTLVFCASILRGQTNLLPPNKKEQTQMRLQERYSDLYIIHDWSDGDGLAPDLPHFDVRSLDLGHCTAGDYQCPEIDLAHLAAISFTSGSTGDSQPNLKDWRTIVESTHINARHMLGIDDTLYQLATVPPQHMWGLETSVLLPLFKNICVCDARPLFPQDILDTLTLLPEPRMLVSAPVHLRALKVSQLAYPSLKLVLCATSPLSAELAQQVEELFSKGSVQNAHTGKAELREVYGCSEVGSMAVRNTAREESWQLFDGISLEQDNGTTVASTEYLPQAIALQDTIVVGEDGRFKLDGRTSDIVDIAGKRGSLLELNKVLLNFPGILDGVIFMPQSAADAKPVKQGRLAALVVLPKQDSAQRLRQYLSEHFDDVFLPRPIIQVDALPREENGKLPIKRLNTFYQDVKSKA